MVMRASEIDHREATEEEVQQVQEMELAEIESFLSEATVVRNGTKLLAIVEGVAYHIEEIANPTQV